MRFPMRIGADAFYGGCIVLVACAVSAALLLPVAEFAQHTYRSGSDQTALVDANLSWSEIKAGLFRSGDPSYLSAFGASVLSAYLLAFVGLLGAHRREAIAYALLFLVLFDCSIGPPLPVSSFVEAISPFQIAQPQRAFVLCCLPLGILVGFGVEFLRERFERVSARVIRTAAVAAASLALLLLAGLPLTNFVAALVIVLNGLVVLSIWRPLIPLIAPAACAILIAEAVVINHIKLPALFDRSGALDVRMLSDYGAPLWWTSNSRSTDLAPNRHLYLLQPAINGYDPLYLGKVWRLIAPWYYNFSYRRILPAHDTVLDNPYPFLFMKRPFWLARQYVEGPLPPDDPLFPPTTTAFVESGRTLSIPEANAEEVIGRGVSTRRERELGVPERIEGVSMVDAPQSAWKLSLSTLHFYHAVLRLQFDAPCPGTLHVYVNDPDWVDRLPVYFATIDEGSIGQKQLDVPLPDLSGGIARITWNPTTGECELAWNNASILMDDGEDRLIRIDRRTFNSVRVAIRELPGPRLLAFIDANYPGWSVTVDDRPALLLRVNTAFKGVELGSGAHVVEFRFESATLERGLAISIATATAILIALIIVIGRNAVRRFPKN